LFNCSPNQSLVRHVIVWERGVKFPDSLAHHQLQRLELAGTRPSRRLLAEASLFGQRISPVVHEKTTVTFDLD
jgi:hypothetical protein